jgi:uncharacterized membrane protein
MTMSELIVVAYPDEYRAAEVLATVRRLQAEYLIDLEDAIVVTKDSAGKVKLHQSHDLTTAGVIGGAIWGTVIGLFFMVPFLGTAIGAGIGALTGSLSDYGIDDNFARELSAQMTPGSSAIFVLERHMTADKVIPVLSPFGGSVLRTSLPNDLEATLRQALAQGQTQAPAAAEAGRVAEVAGAAGGHSHEV